MSPALRALLFSVFRTHSLRSGLEECRQLGWLWILVIAGLRCRLAYDVRTDAVDALDVVDEMDKCTKTR